ncbi:MAG: hypothetical protein RLZZ524_2352 [Pseudomonadota bacterium]|jgi:hypothetical protein
MGEMADMYDYLLDDEDEDFYDGGRYQARGGRRSVNCTHCKARGLAWGFRQRWLLLDPSGTVHDCRPPAALDEFPITR